MHEWRFNELRKHYKDAHYWLADIINECLEEIEAQSKMRTLQNKQIDKMEKVVEAAKLLLTSEILKDAPMLQYSERVYFLRDALKELDQ